MKKAVILGCENSHADLYLKLMSIGKYPELEVIGVYSHKPEAMQKLHDAYGVHMMESFDEAVGKVDGIIVTAQHGDRHYKYAKPYIADGAVMYIDKPITIDEDEALKFMKELKEANIPITGGSACREMPFIQQLKKDHENNEGGKTLGGYVRAPIHFENDNGGFYFYAEHLVDMLTEVYGYNPRSVKVYKNEEKISVVFRYDDYDVHGMYVDKNDAYYASRDFVEGAKGAKCDFGDCFEVHFREYYDLLLGGKQKRSYSEIMASVCIMNAIKRSLDNGTEEKVTEYEI